MKKIYISLFAVFFSAFVMAQSSTVVISQAYGGGSTSGSPIFRADFVELHNLSTTTQSIAGYSLQYGSAIGQFASTASNLYVFPVGTTIPSGGYLLVQLGNVGAVGAVITPTPDLTTTSINMSAASGKVALVSQSSATGCGATATPCVIPSALIIDLVAFGASNNGEGGTTANNGSALTNAQSVVRKNNGCQDTDNNNLDFVISTAPVLRNSATAPIACTSPTISSSNNITNLTTSFGVASAALSFNIFASNLTPAAGSLTITPSSGIEISFDNVSFSSAASQLLPYTSAGIPVTPATPIYVRIAASASQGAVTGTITCSGGGASANAIVNVSGSVTQNFYTKPTGDLSMLSTWGTTASDGTGSEPIDFTSPYQVFIVKNRATAVPAAHWEISGTGSKLIIGDGLTPTTVTTTLIDTIKPTTLVDVAALSTLEIGNRVAPTFGILGIGSTVNYNLAATTILDTVKVNVANYSNLKLQGGLKYFKAGIITVNNDLVFDNVVNSNGGPSPFTTISLKGNLQMVGTCNIEDSTTGFANRFTLSLSGNVAQSINTNGNELSVFRLIRDTTAGTDLDITLTANSKLTLGNNSGGELRLLQKVSGTPTSTKLFLANNSRLAITKNGYVFTDPIKTGSINATNANILINKSVTSINYPGTLKFESGSTLNELTINITTPAKDTLSIGTNVAINSNLNLTEGVIITAPTTSIILNAAATITGGSTASYVDGKLRKINPVTTSFLFPVGQAKQYAPIEMSGLTVADDFTVQYFKQVYTTLAVSAATTALIPTYAISNKEYWNIDRIGTGTPNIKFYYNANSLGNPLLAKIAHFNGLDWDDIGSDGNGTDVNGNFISKNIISTFSPFSFGGLPNALPIKLGNFNVFKNDKIVKIQFSTIEEVNTNYFEIERSSDAKKWNLLSTIKANSNSSNTITYYETDYNPTTGVNFYRIKTVDNDGKISYSAIKSVLFSTNFDLVLSPNPVKNILQVLLSKKENETALITIVNSVGAKVFEQTTTKPILFINAASFAKGTYHVRVVAAEHTIAKTIIIQ